jgi:hypothetical protein
MAKQAVSYVAAGEGDTGEGDAASIQPVTNGESGNQTVFQRPSENLRSRTEIVRSLIENAHYRLDADIDNVLSGGGTVTWGGSQDLSGTGIFTISAPIVVRPFLATKTSTAAQITFGPSGIGTGVQIITNLTTVGGVTPPRAYKGANKISVQVQGSSGAPLAITVGGTPADDILLTIDTTGTTESALITFLNGQTSFTGLGLAAQAGASYSAGTLMGAGSIMAATPLSGAVDAEQHVISQSGLATFFATSGNLLAQGDTLAIFYNDLVDASPTSYGGRRQSIGDLPENSTNVDGNLFILRLSPQNLPLAIPVCTVVGDELVFANNATVQRGVPAPILDAYVHLAGDTMTGPLVIGVPAKATALTAVGGAATGGVSAGPAVNGTGGAGSGTSNFAAPGATFTGGASGNVLNNPGAPGVVGIGGASTGTNNAGMGGKFTGNSPSVTNANGGPGATVVGGAANGTGAGGNGLNATGGAGSTAASNTPGSGVNAVGGVATNTGGTSAPAFTGVGGAAGDVTAVAGPGAALTGGAADGGVGAPGVSLQGTGSSPGLVSVGGPSAGGTASGGTFQAGTGSGAPGLTGIGDGTGSGVVGFSSSTSGAAITADAVTTAGSTGIALKLRPNTFAPSIFDTGLASPPSNGLGTSTTGLLAYWDTALQCMRRWDPTVHNFANTAVGQWTHTPLTLSGSGNPTGFTTNLYTAGGSGWVDGVPSTSTTPVTFWKDFEGCVHFEGTMNCPSMAGTGTVATLPIGFRPAVAQALSSAFVATDPLTLTINTNGVISFVSYGSGNGAIFFTGTVYRTT